MPQWCTGRKLNALGPSFMCKMLMPACNNEHHCSGSALKLLKLKPKVSTSGVVILLSNRSPTTVMTTPANTAGARMDTTNRSAQWLSSVMVRPPQELQELEQPPQLRRSQLNSSSLPRPWASQDANSDSTRRPHCSALMMSSSESSPSFGRTAGGKNTTWLSKEKAAERALQCRRQISESTPRSAYLNFGDGTIGCEMEWTFFCLCEVLNTVWRGGGGGGGGCCWKTVLQHFTRTKPLFSSS